MKKIVATLGVLMMVAATGSANAIPFHDDVGSAGQLLLDVIAELNNNGATVEAGEPDPGVGSGSGLETANAQDGWSWSEDIPVLQHTVWAWFIAPQELISIDFLGSTETEDADSWGGSDMQFALWSVLDVSDFSSFSEVAANDDSSPTGPEWAPYIAPISLVSGDRYYLQVDGYDEEIVEYGQVLVSTVARVPAPSALMLFGLGLASLGWSRRKKA
ncbi:MAG: hypothetical protein DRR04_12110 [Gammaproteobacteria bacterium]|nr:MAG: hypothetical protein DRR04_12110 [Gammaproteobacteria bacterium]